MQCGLRKNYVPHEEKTYGKANCKRYHEGCNMGFESKESNMEHFFVKDIIIADKINENIKESIGTSTSSIAKSLLWHDPSKRRIKQIDK